jgi:hypothetical protein
MHIGNKNDSHWIKVKKTTPDSPTSPVHPSAANSSFHAPPPLQQGLRGLSKFVPLVPVFCSDSFSRFKGFSEFVELISRVAVEGLQQPNYHIIFPTPFSKALAVLTVWGIADLRKLEEVRVIRTDEAL